MEIIKSVSFKLSKSQMIMKIPNKKKVKNQYLRKVSHKEVEKVQAFNKSWNCLKNH